MTAALIGIMGGAFDPVHFGHLRSALEVYEALSCDEVRFIPTNNPPHKTGLRAEVNHRLAMLQLALENESAHFVLDGQECERAGLSYSVDTLHALYEMCPH